MPGDISRADDLLPGIFFPSSGRDLEPVEEYKAARGCSILAQVVNSPIFRRCVPGLGCFAGGELDDRYEIRRKGAFANIRVTGRRKYLAAT